MSDWLFFKKSGSTCEVIFLTEDKWRPGEPKNWIGFDWHDPHFITRRRWLPSSISPAAGHYQVAARSCSYRWLWVQSPWISDSFRSKFVWGGTRVLIYCSLYRKASRTTHGNVCCYLYTTSSSVFLAISPTVEGHELHTCTLFLCMSQNPWFRCCFKKTGWFDDDVSLKAYADRKGYALRCLEYSKPLGFDGSKRNEAKGTELKLVHSREIYTFSVQSVRCLGTQNEIKMIIPY